MAVVWHSVDLVDVMENSIGTETIHIDLTSHDRLQYLGGDWLFGCSVNISPRTYPPPRSFPTPG